MAVTKKATETNSTPVVETPKFTGLASFTIVDVMPTNKSLKDNDFYVKEGTEEKEYITKNGNGKTKVQFDVIGVAVANIDGKEVSTNSKFTLWLEQEPVVSKEGKPMFINQLWKTQYGNTKEEVIAQNEEAMKKYLENNPDKKSASFMALGSNLRQAFVGERQLMELAGKANRYKDSITIPSANGEDEVENNFFADIDSKPFTKEWYKEVKDMLVGNTVQLIFGKTTNGDKDYFQPVVLRFQDSFLADNQKLNSYFVKQFLKGIEGSKFEVQSADLTATLYTDNTFTPSTQKVENGSSEADTEIPF